MHILGWAVMHLVYWEILRRRQCVVSSVRCALFSVECTVRSVNCTECSLERTTIYVFCAVQCMVDSVKSLVLCRAWLCSADLYNAW